jgi:transcriptional regulator with XRE-family HTH domain
VQHGTHSVQHQCLLDAPDVPAVLRMARAALGWSQADFSLVAKVSVRTVKALELGQTDPKLSTLKRVANVLRFHGVHLWRDGAGAVGITVEERERKVVPIKLAG